MKKKAVPKVQKMPRRGFTKTQERLLAYGRLMDEAQLLKAMQGVVEKTRTDENQFAALPALLAALVRAVPATGRQSEITVDQVNRFLTHMHEHCNLGSPDKAQMTVTAAIRSFAKSSGISQRTLERLWASDIPKFQRLRASVKFVQLFASGKRRK